MKAPLQTGFSLSACGHAQAGGCVPVPPEKRFLINQINHDGKLAVGDSIFKNPDHVDGVNYIGLIKHDEQKASLFPLCRHDTDWSITHPHPIFTPDDRFVVFDSTREGNANVYIAPVTVD